MRFCVIGNSHVGMVRAAARDIGPDGPGFSFFAKAGAGIEKAVVEGSVIAAREPDLRAAQARFGMPEAIDVSSFDATILVAGTASVYNALGILRNYRVSGWPSANATGSADASESAAPLNRALVSEAAFVAALTDHARTGFSFRFARAFRQACKVPIFVVPQPYPSERVFESARPREYGFHRVRRHGEGAALARCLNRAIAGAFADIGDVTVLHQPSDTVAHGFTTAQAYTRDAVRVDGNTAQNATDFLHVGGAFGKRVVARVIDGLEGGIAA